MKLTVKQKEDFHFVGKSESGEINIDAAGYVGGKGRGIRPPELFLYSIAGCMGIHAYEALHKTGKHVEDVIVDTDSERREEKPKVFTKIMLSFTVKGKGITEEDVKKAVEEALTSSCSIAYLVNKACPITYSINLVS